MFGILDCYGYLYEETFKTIEDVKDYIEETGTAELSEPTIVELVPRLKGFIPPAKICWEEVN